MIEVYGPPLAPPVDHACWLLERMGLPFDFVPAAAALSAIRSSRLKVAIELPLILVDGAAHCGFRASFSLLHETLGSQAPNPQPKPDAALADSLFDDLFGQAVRCFYREMLGSPKLLKPLSTQGVPAWHRWVVHGLYPLWRWALVKGLKLDSSDAAADAQSMQRAFALIEAALGDKVFLGGSAPDSNDILFAVVASPVILPPGHPVPMPGLASLPAPFRAIVERYRAMPAGQLALRIYAARQAGDA